MENAVLKSASVINIYQKRIRRIRFLTKSTFVLTIDRDNFQFTAGQHITVGTQGSLNQREYSVYSGEKQNYLEILVKEVLDGNVSIQLRNSKPGDLLEVNTILHGIRYLNEAYDKNEYSPERYLTCTSKEKSSGYNGRVTDFLVDYRTEPGTLYYLCGNSNMIYEVTDQLKSKGVTGDRILREVYF